MAKIMEYVDTCTANEEDAEMVLIKSGSISLLARSTLKALGAWRSS